MKCTIVLAIVIVVVVSGERPIISTQPGYPSEVILKDMEYLVQEGNQLEVKCVDSNVRLLQSMDDGIVRRTKLINYNIVDGIDKKTFKEFFVKILDIEHPRSGESNSVWSIHIFAKKEYTGWYLCVGKNVFIPNTERIREFAHGNNDRIYIYVNSSAPFCIDAEEYVLPVVEGRAVIPCRPTSPTLPVILEIDDGTVQVPESTTYDPRFGFDIKDVTPRLRKAIFKCKINETHRTYNVDRWPTYVLGEAVPVPLKITGGQVARVNLGESAILSCDVEGYPVSNLFSSWVKNGDSVNTEVLVNKTSTLTVNRFCIRIWLNLTNVTRGDNGTYQCNAVNSENHMISDQRYLMVIEVPEVNISFAKAVGARRVYLNWTVYNGNDPVKIYSVQQIKNGTEEWEDCSEEIRPEISSYVAEGLEENTAYQFRINATNSIGTSRYNYSTWITTLKGDPEIISRIWINGTSDTSITIGWSAVPSEHQELVHYYRIRVSHGNDTWKLTYLAGKSNYYILEELETGEEYSVEVAACSNYTKQCGNWSRREKTTVMDRDPKFTPIITLGATTFHSIEISWSKPKTELQRKRVRQYKVLSMNWEGEVGSFFVNESESSYIFGNLRPNTSYRLRVAACSEYETQCGDWSSELGGLTVDRMSGLTDKSGQVMQWVVGSIVAILLLFIMAIWMSIRNRRELAARRRFMEATIEIFKAGARDSLDPELDIAEQAELLPYSRKWEFPRKLLKLDNVMGTGAFGIVRKAEARSICKGEKFSTVAVKMVRATHRIEHMTALTRELKILAHLGKHVNIVNLLGACTKRVSYGELLVIVEFCRFGNLHDYLLRRRADFVDQVDEVTGNISGFSFRTDFLNAIDIDMNTSVTDGNPATEECSQSTGSNDTSGAVHHSASDDDFVEPALISSYEGDFADSNLKPIGTHDLLCWAWQVSRGMNYLSSKKVVHGDLAARNILLADNNVVKICDFGLAKSLYAGDIYKKRGHGPIPVKWMAIESIEDRVFSVKSDVWSFGVVLWEFFALAATPYPGIPNEMVYQKLVDGFRMEPPKYATRDIYQLMVNCWDAEPSKRPSFAELEDSIDNFLDEKSKEHYLDFDVVYAKINEEEFAVGHTDVLTMSASEYASNATEMSV